MASPSGDSVVRIWTHTVSESQTATYEARLRDELIPELGPLPGHRRSQLLRSAADGMVRFTVVSHFDADVAEMAMRRIDGPLSVDGHATVHRVLDDRPVDYELSDAALGGTVFVEPVTPVKEHRRGRLVTALAAGVILVVLVAWLAGGDDAPAAPGGDPTPSATATATPATIAETPIAEPFIPWPDPPDDHDPHVIGRPGPGVPIREDLDGQTLVYVNERMRPTVLDLSTGDQRELDIAETRATERFLLENGRVVVTDELDPDFPLTSGYAFVFQVVVDGAAAVDTGPAPTLCLTAAFDCADRPWTSGRFGNDERGADSIAGTADDALAALFGATVRSRDGRWTTYETATGIDLLRVPTPAPHATVWLITEP